MTVLRATGPGSPASRQSSLGPHCVLAPGPGPGLGVSLSKRWVTGGCLEQF